MKKELSILIPVYNSTCTQLVRDLHQQALQLGIDFEIIVAEDGSANHQTIQENHALQELPHCTHIERKENGGRAVIRNFLARQARFRHLLFVDCDMTVVSSQFLYNYLSDDCDTVIDGGVVIGGDAESLSSNLRYRYEKQAEPQHSAEERRKRPYQHLHTANLFVRKDVMEAHPFDERFRSYGYEDVLLGKTLQRARIEIAHIDNPLGFCTFEENPDFVAKTEEGLRTLSRFQHELRGYSRLLTFVEGIHIPLVLCFFRCWHWLFGRIERRWLCSPHPNLKVFKLYKIGYFLTLNYQTKERQ